MVTSAPLLVGVDIGTQSLKAVVVDETLALLGEGSQSYGVTHPRPGWAEQDPADWERALAPAIAAALAAAGRAAADVRALAVVGQLDGCVAVDAAGAPLARCLIWMDRRAVAEAASVSAALVRARGGVTADASHLAAKARWLRDHLPARPARYHQPVSYLVARLTGAAVYDHALASTTMLYGLAARAHDAELLAAFGLEAGELPAIAEAAAVAGPLHAEGAALTGLPAGIPVAVGTGDDFATPLGAGVAAPGTVACVIGTAEVVGALHPTAVLDDAGLVETHGYPGGAFFVENPGWLSGGAQAWLTALLRLDGFEELERLAAAAPAGAAGVTFLPALSGAMTPEWNAAARGCFYGLTPAHGAGELARALHEGAAFALRDVVERLAALGVATDEILLLGGGARSELAARIRADLTGRPVAIPDYVDTCAVGGALLAAVAAGLQPDVATAAARLGALPRRTVAPDPAARAAYDRAYEAYHRLYDALRPMYGEGS